VLMRREARHVETDFTEDRLRHHRIDARDGIDALDGLIASRSRSWR
jgi:hypothetical protein